MKTIKQHLETLPEPYREMALNNTPEDRLDDCHTHSIEATLMAAFIFRNTPEGSSFWHSVVDRIDSGEELPELETKRSGAVDDFDDWIVGDWLGNLVSDKPEDQENEPYEEDGPGVFPTDAAERKKYPVCTGCLEYFPHALAAVANQSYEGNRQHHPEKHLHWDKSKSSDESDALIRHQIEGDYVAVAWRALAQLERHLTNTK